MALQKVSFYVRDPDICTSDLEDETPQTYTGDERRKSHRRRRAERRAEVRFDMNKGDRRQLDGRRDGDATPKFW